jgi:hypothetical protein
MATQKESFETFETLVKLPVEDLTERSKDYFVTCDKLVAMKTTETKCRRQAGKVMAAFKVVYAEKVNAGDFPKGTSFAEYFKSVTDKAPNGRVEQCANTFNHFVVSNLIEESDYDKCATDWLEKASVIVKQADFDLENETVIEVADILHERYGDSAKRLRQLKAKAKGQESKTDDEGKPFTLETVVAFLKIATDKCYATDIFRIMTDLIGSEGKDWHPEIQRTVYLESQRANGDVWDKVASSDRIESWIESVAKKEAPIQIVQAPNFEEHAISLYANIKGKAKARAVAMLQAYHAEHGELPEKAAFEAYGNNQVAAAA